MTGQELIDETRRRLRDNETPQLWTDTEILAYLVEAERQFAERTHVLLDFDNYSVTTAANTTVYSLDNAVLSVLLAQLSTSDTPLSRINSTLYTVKSSVTSEPRKYSIFPGVPLKLSLAAAADGIHTINLVAAIRPTAAFTAETSPEIPTQYHMDLPYGAMMRCFAHADTDGFSPELADIAERKWYTALRDAKREMYRMMHSFNTLADFRSWTGGRN